MNAYSPQAKVVLPLEERTIAEVTSGRHKGQQVALLYVSQAEPETWACTNVMFPKETLFIESHQLIRTE